MYRFFLKRMIDLIFSIVCLPIVLIVILIIGPIIYFQDPGPVFYNADRFGKNGQVYKMFKLRSMKLNAPDIRNEDGSTYNSEDDSRLLPIGKFIRKASLDELPQILNVLFGDMSLIGPRPLLADRAYEDLSADVKLILTIRPGITGFNQARYRNSINQFEKNKNDIMYVEKYNFKLDFLIICETLVKVVGSRNIYNK